MDILIKGMEMPKERKMFVIETDGSVWEQIADTSYFCTGYKAVELPPHGRLKDESDILRIFDKYLPKVDDDTNALLCEILAEIHLQAPTIVEAST